MPGRKSNISPVVVISLLYAIPTAMAAIMVFFGVKNHEMALIVGGGVGLVFVAAAAPLAILLAGAGGRLRDEASIHRSLQEIRENSMPVLLYWLAASITDHISQRKREALIVRK